MNDPELALLRQARTADETALAAIYDTYHTPLYRYIYRQVGDVETARDLTAQVFQRFLQALQRESGPERQLKAWLYRTAHNLVVDLYRRQEHRRHLPLEDQTLTSDADPAWQAEQQLLAADVREALRELTPDQRQVITLKFLAGMSNAEVASVIDKPVGAVKSLQHRALAALQRQLVPAKEKVR